MATEPKPSDDAQSVPTPSSGRITGDIARWGTVVVSVTAAAVTLVVAAAVYGEGSTMLDAIVILMLVYFVGLPAIASIGLLFVTVRERRRTTESNERGRRKNRR